MDRKISVLSVEERGQVVTMLRSGARQCEVVKSLGISKSAVSKIAITNGLARFQGGVSRAGRLKKTSPLDIKARLLQQLEVIEAEIKKSFAPSIKSEDGGLTFQLLGGGVQFPIVVPREFLEAWAGKWPLIREVLNAR